MSNPNIIRLALAALTLAGVAAAATLEALGHDSSEEWKFVALVAGALVGQHLDKPQ